MYFRYLKNKKIPTEKLKSRRNNSTKVVNSRKKSFIEIYS